MVSDMKQAALAREFLLKARIYRFLALVFAFVGLIVFIILFLRYMNGDVTNSFSLSLVVMILLPFLPAAVLAHKSARMDRKLQALLAILSGSPADGVQKP